MEGLASYVSVMSQSFYVRQSAIFFGSVVFGVYLVVLTGMRLEHLCFFGGLAVLGQWVAPMVPGFGGKVDPFEAQCHRHRLGVYLGVLLGIIPVLGAQVFASGASFLATMPDWRWMVLLVGAVGIVSYSLRVVRESGEREAEMKAWFGTLTAPRIRHAGEWVKVFDPEGSGSESSRWMHEDQWRFFIRHHGLQAERVRG